MLFLMKFNKILLVVASFLALAISSLGQNNIGTLVTDPIRPFSVSSTHPSAIANEIKGGPFTSSNLAGLSNIPAPRLEIGAIGYATNTGLYYRLTSTNPATWSSINGANITNIAASNVVGALATNGNAVNLTNFPTVALASNVTGIIAISNGGTGATNAGGARTNLGLGATWLTNTVASNFRTAIGATAIGNALFTATNSAAAIDAIGISTNFGDQVLSVSNIQINQFPEGVGTGFVIHTAGETLQVAGTNVTTATPAFYGWNGFAQTAFSTSEARTNLGLAWPALTNSNAGTGLVSVNTNGEVVSPTNFWQVAPIQTLVQDFTGIAASQTNNATNARNVYIYSFNTNVSGISNTIILPTNTLTFNGDEVAVIHKGTTNTTTVIRQAGSTNNLITLNKFDESVKFIRELGQWDFYHNISFVEPIQFSGTNAVANVAASRTNLGLGATNDVYFQSAIFGTNIASSIAVIDDFGLSIESSDTNTSVAAISFNGTATDRMAANTRTNLGLPLTALTNTSNVTFQQAIFTTNAAPTNGGAFGDHVAWMGVSIVTNGVTNTFKIPLYK